MPCGLLCDSMHRAVMWRDRRTKCSVMLGLRCRRVNETIDTHEDRCVDGRLDKKAISAKIAAV